MINTVYIEDEVRQHPRTQAVLEKLPQARQININRYGEVFNKHSQNFRLQKKKPALILARKHSNRILPVPDGFGIGDAKNFYFAHMSNCLFDCRYCFLQGMYTSANYVLFVNFEDFDADIEHLVRKYQGERLTFFSGYDCDSLALEHITGFAAHILPIFKKHFSSMLEFRTKSIQTYPLDSIFPLENCVIAFSLLPEIMSDALDYKAPSIFRRLVAMKKLADQGWKIGLRFDPLIHGKDWQRHYTNLFEKVFDLIPEQAIHSVSYGPLRFPKAMYRRIVKMYPEEKLFSTSLPEKSGMVAYKKEIEDEMANFCRGMFAKFVSKAIVFQCSPEAQATKRSHL